MDEKWKVPTTICWGQRDRWLEFDGVEDFCKETNHKLIELPMVRLIHLRLIIGCRQRKKEQKRMSYNSLNVCYAGRASCTRG